MMNEQISQIINAIEQLGNNRIGGIDYIIELSLLIISSTIAFVFAFFVASYQVNKSKEQQEAQRTKDISQQEKYREEDQRRQELYRIEDIQRQKSFMIDQLKIENAQEFLKYTISFHTNIMNMINYGNRTHKLYKNDLPVKIDTTSSEDINSDSFDFNLLIFKNSEAIELHLNNLYTLKELFDFNQEKCKEYDDFKDKIRLFHNSCIHADKFDEYKSANLGQDCINLANSFDRLIREELNKLLKTMK